ncbi:MAG: DEAD/DEAH box helicase [Lentisphaeraceae bacterium]|nr:DEAD/DEAH box helicase [Lentisphaeraceae bacterium]
MELSYIERLNSKPTLKGLDAFFNKLCGVLDNQLPRRDIFLHRARKVIKKSAQFSELSEAELNEKILHWKAVVARGKLNQKNIISAMAVISEASYRSMKMRPYKVQLAAALSMQSGCIAEMATGEGKSLTAALAAVLTAWKGRGCHVMTSNSYLATRDAEEFTPLFEYCDVRVASLSEDTQGDDRRQAYRSDITYCTNKDVAADFLRDQISMGSKQTSGRVLLSMMTQETKVAEPILRGLEFAIVDEADSVMIDDGVTPLLISTESGDATDAQIYLEARKVSLALKKEHYKTVEGVAVELSDSGRGEIDKLTKHMGGPWRYKRRREELISQALKAEHLFHNDKQYIIDEGKVVIVDQATGRTMPDRTWRDGMHQAVEAKEELEISPAKDTCARISFQKFFGLYRSLSGMTGTASEAASEFYSYYHLPVVKIPTHRRCKRKFLAPHISRTEESKLNRIVKEVAKWHERKRPILVGTASIKESELISEKLKASGIEHQILNAKNHKEESEIVKTAGQEGKVTVATSMAGRGTDIKLSDGACKVGGLFVITTQLYHSKRVDRQLYGRCSRQGDPGAVKCFFSLDDDLLMQNMPYLRYVLLSLFFIPSYFYFPIFKMAQYLAVSKSRKQRKAVLKNDDWLDDILGFTGEGY